MLTKSKLAEQNVTTTPSGLIYLFDDRILQFMLINGDMIVQTDFDTVYMQGSVYKHEIARIKAVSKESDCYHWLDCIQTMKMIEGVYRGY